jgi:hypothetical protein
MAFDGNLSPNAIAQNAHWLGAGFAVLASVLLFGPHIEWWAVGAMLAFASVKEFWFDPKFEGAPFIENLQDWAFYLVGLGVAIGLLFIKGIH